MGKYLRTTFLYSFTKVNISRMFLILSEPLVYFVRDLIGSAYFFYGLEILRNVFKEVKTPERICRHD